MPGTVLGTEDQSLISMESGKMADRHTRGGYGTALWGLSPKQDQGPGNAELWGAVVGVCGNLTPPCVVHSLSKHALELCHPEGLDVTHETPRWAEDVLMVAIAILL